jgi:hypothetical protein
MIVVFYFSANASYLITNYLWNNAERETKSQENKGKIYWDCLSSNLKNKHAFNFFLRLISCKRNNRQIKKEVIKKVKNRK